LSSGQTTPNEPVGASSSPARKDSGAALRIIRNAASILLGNAGGEILTTYAIALAAVSLGPAGFGELSEAQAFMDPFDVAASFGLGQVAITMAARRGHCDGALRGTIGVLRLGFSVLALIVGVVAAVLSGRSSLLPVIIIIGVGMLFVPWFASSALPFQFGQTMHLVLVLPFLTSVVRFGTAYAARYLYNAPAGYQLSGTISALASTLLWLLMARRYYPARLTFDLSIAKELLHLSWPAAALEIVVTLYSRGSYFLLHQAGAHVQGEYAAADKLLRPVFGIAGALFASALPTVAAVAVERDFHRILRMYASSIRRLVFVVVPILGCTYFVTPWLLRYFVPDYAGAVGPFRWLSFGAVFMLLNQLSTMFVIALGRFQLILKVAIVNFVVYFGLAWYLVPRWQATGAAIATTVMEGINTVIQLVLVFALLHNSAAENRTERP
jgi:PST family polysaccharide transporter